MEKIALITGATSGIGLATARVFAENNYQLIICGRREERLNALKEELQNKVEIYSLCFDISSREACTKAFQTLPEKWTKIDILINNAGNAHGLDLSQDASLDDWEQMIDINLKGVMYLTKLVLPAMLKKKSGHIINLGSIAGKETYLKGNMYCATKHAVVSLSDGLRQDLNGTGIKVSTINPGAVDTEFSEVRFKGDKNRASKVYEGFEPLHAQDIAELIEFIVSRPAHVNIADTIIFPTDQGNATMFYRR